MKKIIPALFILSLFVINPVFARHNDSFKGVSTRHLDNDPAEEIPVPVLFGVNYERLVPDFGDSRGGGTREHEGQDMRAPKGTPIVSPTEAVVLSTGNGPSAGKYVYTINPGKEVFRYMHLDSIADIERGDKLDVGDFIGTVGDTGNAPDGVYHLHFEIRDEDNDPLDPHPRLAGEFKERDIENALEDIFRDIRKDEDYAKFLLEEFPSEVKELVRKGVNLPRALEDVVDDEGLTEQLGAEEQLIKLLKTIPSAISPGLKIGDQGSAVILIQIYLTYLSEGPERDRLVASGATGYFGPITRDAIKEYQLKNDLLVTGVYDANTRAGMIK